jgi:hypothetical protein
MEDIVIFLVHLVSFLAIWHILCPFGIFYPRFGILYKEKSGNPDRHSKLASDDNA